jgi:WD40 repeat protein
LLLLLLILLVSAGAVLSWQLAPGRGPDVGGAGQPRGPAGAVRPPDCSDDRDPKYLEPLEFGDPVVVPLARRPLEGLARTPLPAVEVYPWQPENLVAVLGEHRMRGHLFASSPDHQTLAVANGGNLHLGPVGTLHEKQLLSCPGAVAALAWSPAGGRLAVSLHTGAVLLYDVRNPAKTPDPTELGKVPAVVTSLSWSADGKYLIGGDAAPGLGKAHVWEVATGKVVRRLAHAGPVAGVAFSPVPGDYRAVTSGGPPDGRLHLWDAVASDKELAVIDFRRQPRPKTDLTTGVGMVAFSPDGKHALSCHPDGAVRVWALARFERDKEVCTLKGHSGAQRACFSPDGKAVVTTAFADNGVWLWDVAGGKQVRRLEAAGAVGCVGFLGGDVLAFCGNVSNDANVHLHEVPTGKEILPPAGHLGPLSGVAASPDGRAVASVAQDQSMRLWELREAPGDATVAVHRHRVGASAPVGVGFHPGGKRAFCYGGNPPVTLAEVGGGKNVTPAFTAGHRSLATSAGLTGDGRYALTGCQDGAVFLWRLRDGKQVREFEHDGPARVWLAPDMRRAFRAGGPKTRLLHLRCQTTLREWDPVSWAPFLPDGRAVFLGGATSPTWRVAAGGVEEGPPLPCSLAGFSTMHVSPDGKLVAGVRGHRVVVLELGSGKERWSWAAPAALYGVQGVALSADGGWLLTANGDGTAYVIRLP